MDQNTKPRNTHTQLSQLIFDESKGNPMEKEQLFNKRVQTGYSHAKTGRKKHLNTDLNIVHKN